VENLYITATNDGTIGMIYYKKREIHGFVISATGEVLAKGQLPFRYNLELIGEGFDEKGFQFFFKPRSSSKEGDIGIIELSREGQFSKPVYVNLDRRRDLHTIGQISSGGRFFVITAEAKKNELIFTQVRPQGITRKVFRYKPPFSPDVFLDLPILYVDPNTNKSIADYQLPVKLYYRYGNFYFTMDQPGRFRTHIWIIDWEQGRVRQLQVPSKSLVTGNSSNSFLVDQVIFRLTLGKNLIDLSLYDIFTGELIDKYHYINQQTIDINRGVVYQEDELSGSFKSYDFMSKEQLYEQFSNGTASLFAEKINDHLLRLTVGVYNSTSSGLSIGGGFGSFGGSGGISIGGSKQLTGVRQGSTFFDTIFTYPELYLANEIEGIGVSDKINNFLGSLSPPPTAIREFSSAQSKYLAYIVRSTSQLKIIHFE